MDTLERPKHLKLFFGTSSGVGTIPSEGRIAAVAVVALLRNMTVAGTTTEFGATSTVRVLGCGPVILRGNIGYFGSHRRGDHGSKR
jgi:hypothetical protein